MIEHFVFGFAINFNPIETMESQDIRTLRLLEAVEDEQAPSQRELARKLDISLGLVNAFLKRLARKGYFKITNLPANRISYILTPKGLAEKSRLTCEYIRYSFAYYRQVRTHVSEIFADLERGRSRRLVLWGVGELAEIAFVSLAETSLQLVAVVDPGQSIRTFLGHQVASPGQLADLEFDAILVTTMDESGQSGLPAEVLGRQVVFLGRSSK